MDLNGRRGCGYRRVAQKQSAYLTARQQRASANTAVNPLKMHQTNPQSITWSTLKAILIATFAKLYKLPLRPSRMPSNTSSFYMTCHPSILLADLRRIRMPQLRNRTSHKKRLSSSCSSFYSCMHTCRNIISHIELHFTLPQPVNMGTSCHLCAQVTALDGFSTKRNQLGR